MQPGEPRQKRDLGKAVAAVTKAFASGRVGSGERAELRRMAPGAVPPAPFWHIMARVVEPHHPAPRAEEARTEWEKRWAIVLTGMALLDHASERRPGRALAESGFHELRLRRLLRADGERLGDELLAAARFLVAQGSSWDWQEGARLIHYDPERTPEWADPVRRRIARDYFGTVDE